MHKKLQRSKAAPARTGYKDELQRREEEEAFKEVIYEYVFDLEEGEKYQDSQDVLVGVVIGGWDQTVGSPWIVY